MQTIVGLVALLLLLGAAVCATLLGLYMTSLPAETSPFTVMTQPNSTSIVIQTRPRQRIPMTSNTVDDVVSLSAALPVYTSTPYLINVVGQPGSTAFLFCNTTGTRDLPCIPVVDSTSSSSQGALRYLKSVRLPSAITTQIYNTTNKSGTQGSNGELRVLGGGWELTYGDGLQPLDEVQWSMEQQRDVAKETGTLNDPYILGTSVGLLVCGLIFLILVIAMFTCASGKRREQRQMRRRRRKRYPSIASTDL
jgi:hypothetical protein